MSRRGSVFQDGGIGQPLDYRIAAHANAQDKELAYRGEQERLQRKQAERDSAIADINKVKVDDSGINPVDKFKNQAVPALQTEAFRRLQAGENPLAVRSWINSEAAKLGTAYTQAKNSKAMIDNNLQSISKDYEGGDIGKLKSLAYNDLSNDVLELDENGNYVGVKDTTIIPQDKNYTSPYIEPQGLGKWYNASGKLKQYAEDLKLNDLKDSDVYDDKGRRTKHGYSAKSNFLSRPIKDPKTGDIIGMETAYDEVDDGGGNKLKVLPEIQEREILSDPRRAAELNQIVATEIAEIESATGKEIDPKQAHLLMRNRLYQIMDEHKTHTFNTNDEVRIPKPPVTKIYNSNNTPQPPTVRQMYKGIVGKVTNPDTPSIKIGGAYLGMPMNELESDEAEAIVNEVKKAKGITDVDTDDWFVRHENGKLKVYAFDGDHPKPTTAAEAKSFELPPALITISGEGVDVKSQVRAKDKVEVVKEYAKPNPKPTAKKDPLGIL